MTKDDKHDEDDTKTIDFLIHEDEHEESGMCGRAIIREFKNTLGTWWVKEMTNLNQKSIATSFFIFFAAVAPAITFGAVYGKVRFVFAICYLLFCILSCIILVLVIWCGC